jgi:hypothetical protein
MHPGVWRRTPAVAGLGALAGLGYWVTVAGLAIAERSTQGAHAAVGYALAGAGAWVCVLGWCGAAHTLTAAPSPPPLSR